MYGLYDPDGILRFMGGDREACVAYAKLFSLEEVECSLLPLPEPSGEQVKGQKRVRRQVMSSS